MQIDVQSCCVVLTVGFVSAAEMPSLNAGWPVVRLVAWCVAAQYVMLAVSVWLATLQTLGLSSLRVCPRAMWLSLRASHILEAVVFFPVTFAAAVALLAYAGRDSYLAVLPPDLILLVALFYFAHLPVPPTVLVFSSSTDKQLRWVSGLKQFTGGRRIMSLLDTGYLSVRPATKDLLWFVAVRAGALTDVLRTSGKDDWRKRVRELIDITPIVIVDARVCTEAVLFEASSVLAPECAHKAIFVSEDDGAAPVLERLLDAGRLPPGRRLNVVKEGELGELLKKLVASRDALPKPGASVPGASSWDERAVPRQAPRPAASSQTSERRRLSNSLTPVLRWTMWITLLNIPLTLAFGLLLTFALRPFLRFGLTVLWALLCVNWVATLLCYYLVRPLKKVSAAGDDLFVSDSRREIKIHVSQISRVTGPDWTTLRRITLHLDRPSAFGTKIIFAGRLFEAGKIARELRSRLYAIAEEDRKAEADD